MKFRVGKEGMMGFVANRHTARGAGRYRRPRILAHPLFPDTRVKQCCH